VSPIEIVTRLGYQFEDPIGSFLPEADEMLQRSLLLLAAGLSSIHLIYRVMLAEPDFWLSRS